MIDVIDAWLRLAADRLHERAAALTALDQAIGDGDHGTNMDRGFSRDPRAARRRADPRATSRGPSPAARLRTAGRTLISTVGGAAGPLYGTALMRAGGAVAESSPDGAGRRGARGRPRRRDRRDPAAGQGHDRREDDARCARAGRRSRADRGGGREGCRRRDRRDGRGRRGRRPRHDPDARDEGPGVVSRRAIDRAPGSGRDVVGPAAARAGGRDAGGRAR